MLAHIAILAVFLLLLIFSISKWNIHPFVALILTGMGLGLAMGMGGEKTVEVLLQGFGDTLRWIAIIVILGAFIGEVLQETGGALRVSDRVVAWVGKKNLPWAMGATGYIVSIPVFVDVAYILLQPVIESLSVKSKKPVLYLGLALTAGLTVSHTLIPPTPGPMAVASMMNVALADMLFVNGFVAILAMAGGVLWVVLYCKNAWIVYDEKLRKEHGAAEIEASESDMAGAGVFADLLPILVPIALIGLGSFVPKESETLVSGLFRFTGIPLVAVLIGAGIAAFSYSRTVKQSSLNRLTEQAIVKSALVIMITGAGGALGQVIRATGVQNELITVFSEFPFIGMMLPFLIAAILTTSTGSITVSLVATASMIGPIVDTLPVSPQIAAALIGCGSFCVFHANSSFFWLLNRLHEVPPQTLYRTYTVQSLIMGFSGLLGVLLLMLLGF
ncbi:GntP family permease [Algoriphagus sp. H41]|uniref:GntP family permease n=1 Tax=Algoriphagus oliviformis TaxID=2811231 RepID=A0ABS3C8C4_9BACT|nr:GntP family permease [Algoriphagus oliviformis]MBN7813352.1 GntP family permease [Algoriphagus oliviformis]